MRLPFEVELAGEGGQGVVLAAIILADAAATYDGRFVAQSASYGPEARGGLTRSEVVISDQEIDYPKVVHPDLLVAMNQDACDKYAGRLKPDGVLVVDSTHVSIAPPGRVYAVPITRLAEESTGRLVTANVVALGVIVGISGAVSDAAVESAVRARSPEGTAEVNLKALHAGLTAARAATAQ